MNKTPKKHLKYSYKVPFKIQCCMISDPEIYTFGTSNSFEKIWFNDYSQFRKEHISGNIPDICKFCYEN